MFFFFQGMFRSRGEMLLFADADGATTFSDLDKVEASLKGICAGKCMVLFMQILTCWQ